jgi:hypothetical protein
MISLTSRISLLNSAWTLTLAPILALARILQHLTVLPLILDRTSMMVFPVSFLSRNSCSADVVGAAEGDGLIDSIVIEA